MSTLRVANLQSTAGTQTVTQDRLYNGAATAWVNFNGTGTVAIRDSYNVSSITDVGVGAYTVNFQTALTNVNYAVSALADRTSQSGFWANPTSYSTTAVNLACAYAISGSSTFSGGDPPAVFVTIFGGY